MMKVFCCKNCRRVSYHARRKERICASCEGALVRLSMPYVEYTSMNQGEREAYVSAQIEKVKKIIISAKV